MNFSLVKYIFILITGIIISGAPLYADTDSDVFLPLSSAADSRADSVEDEIEDNTEESREISSEDNIPDSTEDSGDESFDGFGDFDNFGSFQEEEASFNIKFYTEYRGLISTYGKNYLSDIYKKNELKTNINFKYGLPRFYIQGDTNIFLLPGFISEDISREYKYSNDFSFKRNGTVTSEYGEIDFRELYVNYDKGIWRFRAGNQVHHWGTADAIKPTSYFNPFDLRELLFKDEDRELTMGVPSISALAFIGSDSLEIVVVPFHTPSRVPLTGTYWELNHREGPFPVIIDEEKGIDPGLEGAGAGIKYYRNIKNFDTHVSLFRGPDKEPIFLPVKTESEPDKPVTIIVEPQFNTVTMAGLAISNTYERFIFQFEGVYSPDKAGVVDTEIDSAEMENLLPFKTEKSHYIAYSIGFNYFLPFSPSKEGMVTAEWSRSHLLNDKLMKPFLSDIITIRINEKFLQGKLETSLTAIINRTASLYIASPVVNYRFSDFLSCEVRYAYIAGEKGNYYSGYRDNDFIEWRVRYEY